MSNISALLTVGEDGSLSLPTPLPAGKYVIVAELRDVPTRQKAELPFDASALPVIDMPWPFAEGETFRREDMYGDDER